EDRRQVELLDRRNLGIDESDDAPGAALLHERAHAKAPDARRGDREVALLRRIELLRLAIVHQSAHQGRRLLGGKRALALRAHFPVDLDSGREPGGDEQVRGLFLGDPPQQVLHQLDRLVTVHASPHSLARPHRASLFCALYRASSLLTSPFATSSVRHWSSVCIPLDCPVWMAEYICAILPSRMRLRMAGVPIMISCAAIRPPPIRLSSVCEMTARRLSESMERTISFSAAGNTSTTRSIVFAAELVCSVPKTRCPVSAAVSASRIVSRSRISPTSTTSGSSRSAERSASEKPRVSRCTSRWLMRQRFDSCTNSIGSSMVMIWSGRLSLQWFTMPASVVLLPEPVGPVTSTRPRGSMHRSRNICGDPRSSS